MLRIAAEALSVGRGRTVAAGPLDFTLGAGESLVVTGPNGAGKSTLLRTLAGLLHPLGGRVLLEGALAADGENARSIAEVAHYVGHRNAMKPGISVGRNLDFWRRTLRLAADGLTNSDALKAVGLPDLTALPFGYLSAGQQRRASLARLLVAPRDVWVLDEPTAALDADSQLLFGKLMERHLAAGGIVIAATHQPLGLETAKRLNLAKAPDAKLPAPTALDDDELAEAEGWL
ncbi:putative heme exporter a (cytochrome c-type biogenesis atp-binding protein) abc transporter [Fulvimarina pelagi HTCC2506]|uniref:Putative heme exporter a (Cytochrome c-type biogenesis atp-binding protein) abc transporter n=1 Tax=Fulvimarina pelagi HTCC2506 TaxID=314231 RepID=Q0G0M6_9HYPH|nr:putative heme exporter a (cytochrome c-type biogenesis atp-binding protein) abc transporter [Fulvimarina pelagi HTCC2506]